MSGPHPALDRLLASMPWFRFGRAWTPEEGRYYRAHRAALIQHGLRGPVYFCTLAHEAIHAINDDGPCADWRDEARQEEHARRDAARLLIDIRHLAEAAAAYPNDGERVAEELHVDLDTLKSRMRHLHPAERHYLTRRLAPEEQSA